jgi:hypothetical protein
MTTYPTKEILFGNSESTITILQQQENGPCPILAIANSLALSHALTLPPIPFISHARLVDILTDLLLSLPDAPEDPISIITRLTDLDTGLLITPRYVLCFIRSRPRFCGEMFMEKQVVTLFNVFGIKLVHGYLRCAYF